MTEERCYRKIIRIQATDSPNVRLALSQIAAGMEPTGEQLVPGVISWDEYQKRLDTWDPIRQCIGLKAEFYLGAELLLYPPDWLNRAEDVHETLKNKVRVAKAIGCDPAEGGDSSCWSVVDEYGLIELVSMKTPNTADIPNKTLALMQKYKVPATRVYFDRGGGGQQHADSLRERGHAANSVGFGDSVKKELKPGMTPLKEQKRLQEQRYVFKNRRAQMFGWLRQLLDPEDREHPRPDTFAIPAGKGAHCPYTELRRQMAPIPLLYDREGRLYVPPKNKSSPNSKEVTLIELLGHSCDELDATCLAVYGLLNKPHQAVAGVF